MSVLYHASLSSLLYVWMFENEHIMKSLIDMCVCCMICGYLVLIVTVLLCFIAHLWWWSVLDGGKLYKYIALCQLLFLLPILGVLGNKILFNGSTWSQKLPFFLVVENSKIFKCIHVCLVQDVANKITIFHIIVGQLYKEKIWNKNKTKY